MTNYGKIDKEGMEILNAAPEISMIELEMETSSNPYMKELYRLSKKLDDLANPEGDNEYVVKLRNIASEIIEARKHKDNSVEGTFLVFDLLVEMNRIEDQINVVIDNIKSQSDELLKHVEDTETYVEIVRFFTKKMCKTIDLMMCFNISV